MLTPTEAHSIDDPWAGAPLVPVEFGSPVHHLRVPVALLQVDLVEPAVFDFLHVNVGTKTEDVGVVGCQTRDGEVGQGHAAVGGPLLGPCGLEVLGGGDPRWLQCFCFRSIFANFAVLHDIVVLPDKGHFM